MDSVKVGVERDAVFINVVGNDFDGLIVFSVQQVHDCDGISVGRVNFTRVNFNAKCMRL